MIVLAIDLGETTGYAYVADANGGRLLRYGTATLSQLGKIWFKAMKPDLVVIERPAYVESGMQQHYAEALHQLTLDTRKLTGKTVKVVRPVDWMPRFARHSLPGRGILPTQHEKDAYRIAMWALDEYQKPEEEK